MKKNLIICNSFSINMLNESSEVRFVRTPNELLANIVGGREFLSAVDCADIAELFSKILEVKVPKNRIEIVLSTEDILLVGQITRRLPEGMLELPPGISINWWMVELI